MKRGKAMEQKKIAVFVGSLRQESFNRKMATALTALAPGSQKAGRCDERLNRRHRRIRHEPPPASIAGVR